MSFGQINQSLNRREKAINNSITDKVRVMINGHLMGLIIKGQNTSNPILLFVHGGPGMPEYFLSQKYGTGLEEHFVVVYWDQRGCGLSYHSKIDKGTMTVDQYVEDTIDLTNYLIKRFRQDKIYLMAHSWGTYFSLLVMKKAPKLYKAYIAVAQVTNQDESEKIAYQYMLDYYSKVRDKKAIEQLKKKPYPSRGYNKIRDAYMHRAGIGTTHKMKSVLKGIFLASLLNKEYTILEKINLWRGKLFVNKNTQLNMKHDLREIVTSLEVSTYFFSGIYDYTVNYQLTGNYLAELIAPLKGFYLFESSAHSPIFEEPDKVVHIMINDVLHNKNILASMI